MMRETPPLARLNRALVPPAHSPLAKLRESLGSSLSRGVVTEIQYRSFVMLVTVLSIRRQIIGMSI